MCAEDNHFGSTIAIDPSPEPWPDLRELPEKVSASEVTPTGTHRALRRLPFGHLGFARIDHHRRVRTGLAEPSTGRARRPTSAAIAASLLSSPISGPVALTRADERQIDAAPVRHHGGHGTSSTVVWRAQPQRSGRIVVASAETGDLAVAEECQATFAAYGYHPEAITDVGVARLYRPLDVAGQPQDVDVIVVVAGMEGTLPTAVGGLTATPIIAVPTSVGYGSRLRGHTALLAHRPAVLRANSPA